MNPDPGAVTVVVPTYNEVENLRALAMAVIGHGYRLLIVDDNSPDGTAALADELATRHSAITVLHREHKAGLGPAYAAGIARALQMHPVVVCQMDGDLSHDPAALLDLVAAVATGADVAVGSRLITGGGTVDWPWWRRTLSRLANRYARFALGIPTRDITSGFRAYRAAAIAALDPGSCRANGYCYQVELAWRAQRAGMLVVEVPITFTERRAGTSKMGLRVVAEAMWLVSRWGLARSVGKLPGATRK